MISRPGDVISCSRDVISCLVGAIRQLRWLISMTVARIRGSGDVIN